MEQVLHFELDGAFIGCQCNHPELQSVPAFLEELAIVSAASVADLDEAITKPILVYSTGCSYRDVLEKWMLSIGLKQPIIMEFGTLEAIIGGVSAGLGISLLPRSVIIKQEAEGAVFAHAIPDSISHMKTVFITRKDSFVSSALRAFIETLPNSIDNLRTAAKPVL
jgi:DNA-binding transcriptional LysR family regulator